MLLSEPYTAQKPSIKTRGEGARRSGNVKPCMNESRQVNNTAYLGGFQDVEETEPVELSWLGEPPHWLHGTLFRNGPGRYDRGRQSVNHWFDGLALLHAFKLAGTTLTYRSRFVRSADFRVAQSSGRIGYPGFACDPCRSLFRKVMSAFFVDATENPNISIIKQAHQYLALTELPVSMEFDPETLRSKAPFVYSDSLPDGSTTAHPHQDGASLFNLILHYSAVTSYRLYEQIGDGPRKEFARVPVREPSYVHSFGLTENYAILTCPPFQVTPWRLLTRNRPFIENFRWKPEAQTRFHLLGRARCPALQKTLLGEPIFVFHHVNCYEQEQTVIVDLVAYENADIIEELRLSALAQPRPIPFGQLRRYRLDLRKNTAERMSTSRHRLELPRINERFNTRSYRFVYGVGAIQEQSLFYDRLIKLDVASDRATFWSEPNTFPGEPIFVPGPDGETEDQGVLLSVVLGAEGSRSFLLLLNAQDLEEIARAWLPTVVPHGFHGLFAPKT